MSNATSTPYEHGLHELGNGCHGYLQPDGGWGWSNAGLVVGDGASLLVDTLFDLKLTRQMLDAMAPVTQQAPISTLVNTHANGDHCYGNQLVKGARILATKGTLEDMEHRPPEQLYQMMTKNWQALGEAGRFMYEMMGSKFDFSDVVHTPPTDLFAGELKLSVDRKSVV